MTPKPPKPKRCKSKGCGVVFTPSRAMQAVCSPACAAELAREKREQAEAKKAREARLQHRRAVEKAKPIWWWHERAQKAVNRYVRARDHDQGCISCDKGPEWSGGVWHASHWRSVGASSATRYNLWNIHKACSQCNLFQSGNIGNYTTRIVQKIGAEKADWLKAQNGTRKWTREYLERLVRVFNKKARRQEKRTTYRAKARELEKA